VISLICPTRQRPENMRRFVEHAINLADGPVEIVFIIDWDDVPSRAEALRCTPGLKTSSILVDEPPPETVMSDLWNVGARAAHGDVLGLMGDDIVIRTPGWDRLVEHTFHTVPDRIAYVHGRDGVHDRALGTHGFLHRRWVDAVGRMTPEMFSCDYADAWINEVADRIGRRIYIPDLYTEHLHPAVGKAPVDESHRKRMERGERDNVPQIWADTVGERVRDATLLHKLMGTLP
jgi:hypothetical protein